MRKPDIEMDGWCLDSGEAYHADAPLTFWIPDRDRRERLQPGDYAKLIFNISVDNPEEPVVVERMWVIVRERTPGGYLGVLDNEPDSIGENDEFWVGTELPFRPEHIINIEDRDEASIPLATEEPRTRWPTE
jgi:hypothetical protein